MQSLGCFMTGCTDECLGLTGRNLKGGGEN
jgi:hypothetical protein